jgi:CubicO group peptidase (beta-lactamase class C family)
LIGALNAGVRSTRRRRAPDASFGPSPRAFGTPGAGGSFAFADPDARLGYAYVMNKTDFYIIDDPREKALRDAIDRAIATPGRGSSPRPERVAREDAA